MLDLLVDFAVELLRKLVADRTAEEGRWPRSGLLRDGRGERGRG